MRRPAQIFNFRIQNSSIGSVDVHIDGEIVDASTQEIYKQWFGDETSVSFKSFRDQLEASNASTYNIYINSPGGQVTDAMAMHDYLQDQKKKGKKVNTKGRGIIASAATYILMAGDEPEMSQNSFFMIHNVSGMAWGDVNEVERTANTLRKFNNAIRDFYANATGISKEDINKMMDAETWMSANEAKNKGFIKQISNEVPFTNFLSADYWEYSNKDILAAYNSAVKPIPPENAFDDKTLTTEEKKFLNEMIPHHQMAIDMAKEVVQNVQNPFIQKLAGDIIATQTTEIEEMNDYLAEESDNKKKKKEPMKMAHSYYFKNQFEDMKKFFQNIIDGLKNLKTEDSAKPADIVNQITEALTKPFEELGTEMENSISTAVTNQVKEAETRIQNALRTEYDTKITNLTTQVTELSTKNTALETELADQKGKKTTASNQEDGPKPIGSFNKG